jgi:hypothetical protein
MNHIVSAMFLVVGIIHLLPLSGVLGAERLGLLYGFSCAEPNLAILMRHRAVLFGLLGGLLVFAAFHPPTQLIAFVLGFTSVVSFLALAASVGGYNYQLRRVFIADIVAFVCLLIGIVVYILQARLGRT